MILHIIAGKLLWIRYVKFSNWFSNYTEPEPGLEIVCKWEIYILNVYTCAKLQGINESTVAKSLYWLYYPITDLMDIKFNQNC
jgi:hypothetical protein